MRRQTPTTSSQAARSSSPPKRGPLVVPYAKLHENYLGLPRLPIPSLEATASRYEASLGALADPATVEAHMALFRQFLDTDGERVQQVLIDADAEAAKAGTYPHSYVEKIWNDSTFHDYRGPSAVYINPSEAFAPLGKRIRELVSPSDMATRADDPLPDVQAYVTAYTVHGFLRFAYKMLTKGVDMPEGLPVTDVSQLTTQFGIGRLAREDRDEIRSAPLPEAMGHIVVMHRGHLFRVDTRDAAGGYYTPHQLAKVLRGITHGTLKQPELCIGPVTGLDRDVWASTRKQLESNPANRVMLDTIDCAFMLVCLDSVAWGENNRRVLAASVTGVFDGASTDSGAGVCDDVVNRWYDKHQFVFEAGDTGRFAAIYENGFGNGVVYTRYFSEAHCSVTGTQSGYAPLPELPVADSDVSAAKPLRIDFGEPAGPVAEAVRKAVPALNVLASSVGHEAAMLPYGVQDIKRLKISPDAFFQAAYQLSFFRIHGRLAPTWESASTGGFFHGRTETIRSATPELRAFCECEEMRTSKDVRNVSAARREELAALLRGVAVAHVNVARLANKGQGVDKHLTALRQKSKELGSATGDAFFNDHLFKYSSKWQMSTSQLRSAPLDLDFVYFGPEHDDNYGVGYIFQPRRTNISVSAFGQDRANAMARGVTEAAHDLALILGARMTSTGGISPSSHL